jgi:hypothetical protein
MAVEIAPSGKEEGYDTAYRAEAILSHPTHVCIQLFSRFFGGLCALALFPGPETDPNQPFHGRVNGALCVVLP